MLQQYILYFTATIPDLILSSKENKCHPCWVIAVIPLQDPMIVESKNNLQVGNHHTEWWFNPHLRPRGSFVETRNSITTQSVMKLQLTKKALSQVLEHEKISADWQESVRTAPLPMNLQTTLFTRTLTFVKARSSRVPIHPPSPPPAE